MRFENVRRQFALFLVSWFAFCIIINSKDVTFGCCCCLYQSIPMAFLCTMAEIHNCQQTLRWQVNGNWRHSMHFLDLRYGDLIKSIAIDEQISIQAYTLVEQQQTTIHTTTLLTIIFYLRTTIENMFVTKLMNGLMCMHVRWIPYANWIQRNRLFTVIFRQVFNELLLSMHYAAWLWPKKPITELKSN